MLTNDRYWSWSLIADNDADRHAYPAMGDNGLTFDERIHARPNQRPAHLLPSADTTKPTAPATRGTRVALNAATYSARFVANADAPRAARSYRSQQMRIAFLQSHVHLVGLQETIFKQGTGKADGYWMASTGPQGKKHGITLAVNIVQPYATTARRDLYLQPRVAVAPRAILILKLHPDRFTSWGWWRQHQQT